MRIQNNFNSSATSLLITTGILIFMQHSCVNASQLALTPWLDRVEKDIKKAEQYPSNSNQKQVLSHYLEYAFFAKWLKYTRYPALETVLAAYGQRNTNYKIMYPDQGLDLAIAASITYDNPVRFYRHFIKYFDLNRITADRPPAYDADSVIAEYAGSPFGWNTPVILHRSITRIRSQGFKHTRDYTVSPVNLYTQVTPAGSGYTFLQKKALQETYPQQKVFVYSATINPVTGIVKIASTAILYNSYKSPTPPTISLPCMPWCKTSVSNFNFNGQEMVTVALSFNQLTFAKRKLNSDQQVLFDIMRACLPDQPGTQ
jgi:hypothetical protein